MCRKGREGHVLFTGVKQHVLFCRLKLTLPQPATLNRSKLALKITNSPTIKMRCRSVRAPIDMQLFSSGVAPTTREGGGLAPT